MKYRLFRQIFIACMLVFALTFGVMMAVLTKYYEQRNRAELRDRANYISSIVNVEGWQFLENMKHTAQTRITVVAENGRVLYDSLVNEDGMENHAAREEIQEALRTGTGESFRYSETLSKRTVNYAVRLNNGDILRISMLQNTVLELLVNMLNPMMVVVLLAVLLALLLASHFTKNLLEPINRLDVEHPDDRDVYEEMVPFIQRITAQNKQIYKQMEALREEHRKQDDMRREFTANVSHELKTPLTSISGFAEIIRDGFVQQKDIPHFADNIYKEAQRLIVLVNDILKLSRLEEGVNVHDEMVQVDMRELCEEVADRLLMSARKRNVTLQCTGEPTQVCGVRNMLEEIVYNVCDNAIKYNREGGVVNIGTKIVENEVCVSVRDTGIGIPSEDVDRIFERFYRVNKSHSKDVGGTGLGLSIVKHGMAFHNARITLESEEGKGTEICLWFPAAENEKIPQ